MDGPSSNSSQSSSHELTDTLDQTATRRQANDSPRIHRLPFELLIYIFELVLESRSFADYYKHLYFLVSSCSHWRALIESTPSFWALISSGYSTDGISNILRKSGDVPLVAEMQNPFPGLGEEQSTRWQSLRMLHWSAEEEHRLVNRGLPTLKFLAIGPFSSIPPQSNITSECAPALKGLRLVGSKASSYASNFHTLRFLALNDAVCSDSSLIGALRQNPLLQHVAIHTVLSTDSGGREAAAPLKLAYLTTFDMDDVSGRLVVRVLQSLQAPQLKKLNVRDGQNTGHPDDVTDTVATIRGTLSSSIFSNAPLSHPTIYVSVIAGVGWIADNFSATHLGNEGTHYQFKTAWGRSIPLRTLLSTLQDALGADGINEIPIYLHIYKLSRNRTGHYLREISTLTRDLQIICIYAKYDRRFTATMCSFLSKPLSDVAMLPFPRMRTLHLSVRDTSDESAVESMLQMRYRGGYSAVVAPLMQLNLHPGTDLLEPEALARLVAPGELYTAVRLTFPEVPKCWGQDAEFKEWFYPPQR